MKTTLALLRSIASIAVSAVKSFSLGPKTYVAPPKTVENIPKPWLIAWKGKKGIRIRPAKASLQVSRCNGARFGSSRSMDWCLSTADQTELGYVMGFGRPVDPDV